MATKKAAQKNGHISRKKAGKTYNPDLEADPGPHPVTIEEGTDVLGHTLTSWDCKLNLFYGDHAHQNDATHLTGGITDDALWQSW